MKPLCVVFSPLATRSGYGDQSREIVRHLIASDKYDLRLVSAPWGNCPMDALDKNKDVEIISRIMTPPLELPRQPEIFIHIGVPNEAAPQGKFNILITAGIETTACSAQWIMAMNRMDLILTTSEHSKRVLAETVAQQHDQAGNILNTFKLEKPIEVLHNCMDIETYRLVYEKDFKTEIRNVFSNIRENFCFLFVGHWLKGDLGEDRKNVGLLVKTFCETFKGMKENRRPALILKTSGATFSVLDEVEITKKISNIRQFVGEGCPNVYLLHGDLTEEEMNELYNHPKVKVHISFTKGEGFGLPLLQATQSVKPIVASGWSGHLDFLNTTDAVLLGGELKNVGESAVWDNVILRESQWFNVDVDMAKKAMKYIYENYERTLGGAHRLAKSCKENFSVQANRKQFEEICDKYVPKFAVSVPMKLPTLKKVTQNA